MGTDDSPQSRPIDDQQIARELSRRGVPADEVARLLAGAPVVKRRNAAEAAVVAPVDEPAMPPPFEPHPTVVFPQTREVSVAEQAQAERLMTQANLQRRRGDYKAAERSCWQGIELNPSESAALELYGDILRGLGRVDDAIVAYQRAVELDPKRPGPEVKYGELMLLQHRDLFAPVDVAEPRNPGLALLLSALMPGVGQVYNGQLMKGLVIALVVVVCGAILGWTPWGYSGARQGFSVPFVAAHVVGVLAYAYGLVDARSTAGGGRRRSGWEV